MDIDTKYVAAALECIEDSHDYIQKALSNVQDASSSLNSRLKGRVRGFDGAINSLQMALGATKSIIGKCDAYIEETEKTVESIKELSTEFLLGLGQGPINEDLFNNPEKIKKELDAKREKRRQDEAKEQLKNDLMTWGYSETDADRLVKSAEEGKDLSEELQKLDKEIFEEYCSGDIDRFKAQTEAKVLQNMHYNREESEARKEEIERTISKLEKENDEIKKESKLYDKAVKRAHYDSKKGVYVYLDEKGVFHEFTEEEFDSLKDMQVKANASIEASNTATNNGINTLKEELTTIEENLSNPNKKDFSYNSVEEIDKRIKEIEASLKKEKNPSLSQEKEELLNIKRSIAYILENGKYILQDDFNDKKTLDKSKAREKTHFDNGGNIVVNIFGIEDGKYTFMDSEEYRGALLARMLNGDAKIMPDLQGGALNVVGDNQEFNFYGKEFYFYGNERQLFFNEYQEWVNQSNTTDKKAPVVIAPQEVEIFNYICNKEGYDKGYEYLKGKEKEFDVRSVSIKKAQDSKTALENPWLGAVSIFTAPLEALTNVGKIITRKSAGENLHYSDMYSSSNTWNSAISGDLHRQSEVLGYAYDTLYSADRLMLSAVTSYGLGGGKLASTALNAGLYGAPTFTNTLNAAKNKNINDLDAIRYALFCATSRTLATSHMVTSAMGIEGAFNNALSQGQVASKISSLVNGSSILSKNPELASNVLLTGYCMGSQGLISGTTALADQAITQTADILMNGDKSDLNIKFRNYKELHENATDLDAYAYLVGDALSSSFSTFATSFGAGALLGTVKADGYISHQKNLNQNVNFNEAFEGIPKNPQESFELSNNNPSGGPSGGYHPTSNPSSDGEQGAKSSNVTNTSTSSSPGDWIVVRPKNSEDFDIDDTPDAPTANTAFGQFARQANTNGNDVLILDTKDSGNSADGHYAEQIEMQIDATGAAVPNYVRVWVPETGSESSTGSIQQTNVNITDSIGVKVPVEASIDGKVVDAFTVINEKGGDSVILPFAPSFSTGSDSEISSVDWAKSTGAFTPPQIDILSKINNIGKGVVKDKTMSLDDFNYIYDKSGLPLNLKERLIKQFEKDGIIKDKPISDSVYEGTIDNEPQEIASTDPVDISELINNRSTDAMPPTNYDKIINITDRKATKRATYRYRILGEQFGKDVVKEAIDQVKKNSGNENISDLEAFLTYEDEVKKIVWHKDAQNSSAPIKEIKSNDVDGLMKNYNTTRDIAQTIVDLKITDPYKFKELAKTILKFDLKDNPNGLELARIIYDNTLENNPKADSLAETILKFNLKDNPDIKKISQFIVDNNLKDNPDAVTIYQTIMNNGLKGKPDAVAIANMVSKYDIPLDLASEVSAYNNTRYNMLRQYDEKYVFHKLRQLYQVKMKTEQDLNVREETERIMRTVGIADYDQARVLLYCCMGENWGRNSSYYSSYYKFNEDFPMDKEYTEDELKALYRYVRRPAINTFARGFEISNGQTNYKNGTFSPVMTNEKIMAETTDSYLPLYNALNNHSLPENVIVFRGASIASLKKYGVNIDDSVEEIKRKLAGQYQDDGFMSTSAVINKNGSFLDCDVSFMVDIKAGTPCGNLTGISEFEEEYEILIPPNVSFNVNDVKRIDGKIFVYLTSIPTKTSLHNDVKSEVLAEKKLIEQYNKIEVGCSVSKNSDGSYSFDDGWDVTTISPSVMEKHIENIKTLDDDSIKNYIQALSVNPTLIENPPKNVDIYKDINYEFISTNFGSDISKDDSTGDYIIKNTTVSVEQMNNFINGVNLINDSEVASNVLDYVKNNIMVISSGRASLVGDPKFEEAYSYFGSSLFNRNFVIPGSGLQSVIDVVNKVETLKQDKVLETMVKKGYDITKIFNQDILNNMSINDINRVISALTGEGFIPSKLSDTIVSLAEQKNGSLLHDMLDYEEYLISTKSDHMVGDNSTFTDLDLKKKSIFDIESFSPQLKSNILIYRLLNDGISKGVEDALTDGLLDVKDRYDAYRVSITNMIKYVNDNISIFEGEFQKENDKNLSVLDLIANIHSQNDVDMVIKSLEDDSYIKCYRSVLSNIYQRIQEDYETKLKESFDKIIKTAPYEIIDGVKVYDVTPEFDYMLYIHRIAALNNHPSEYIPKILYNDITMWDKIPGGNPNMCGTIISPGHAGTYNESEQLFDYALGFANIKGHSITHSKASDAGTNMTASIVPNMSFFNPEIHEPISSLTDPNNHYDMYGYKYNEVTTARRDANGNAIIPNFLQCFDVVSKKAIEDAKIIGNEWYNGESIPIFRVRKQDDYEPISNLEVIDISKIDTEAQNPDGKGVDPNVMNMSYGQYDTVYKATSNIESVINKIVTDNKGEKVLLELNDTIGLTKENLAKLPSNVMIRVLGDYGLENFKGLKSNDSALHTLENATYTIEQMQKIMQVISDFESGINPNWNDASKAKYAYDFLNNRFKYTAITGGNLTRESYFDGLTNLIENISTCQGFAHTYRELLTRMGIKCYEISGRMIGGHSQHVFNVVNIDGKTVIVDPTRNRFADDYYRELENPNITEEQRKELELKIKENNEKFPDSGFIVDKIWQYIFKSNEELQNDVYISYFKGRMGDAIKEVTLNDDETFTIKTKYDEIMVVTLAGLYSQNIEQEILDLNERHEALLVNDWLLNHVDNIDSLVNEDPDRQQQINRHISKVAKTLGTDVETFKKVYAETFKRIINDSEIGMRVSNESLSKILDSGEIKNNHLVESDRLDNSETRAQHEEYLFGIPKELAGRDSAIYGMVFPKYDENDPNSTKFYKIGPGSWYGNSKSNPLTEAVIIFKKDSIMDYTTFTNQDSLEHGRNPSALGRVGGIQAPTNVKNPVQTNSWFDLNDIDTIDDLRNATLYNLSPPDDHDTTGYIEAQIYGRYNHTIDNIDHVLFLSEPSDEVIEKLNRLGIKYKISKPLEMMEQEKVIETPHDDTQVMDVSPNSEKNSKVNPNYDLKYNITTDELIVTDKNGSIIDKLPKMINLEPKAVTEFLVSCGAINNTTPIERALENIVSKPSELLSDADLNNIVDTLKSLNLSHIDSSIIDKFRTSDGFDYMGFLNYLLSNSEFTRESVEVFRQLEPIQRVINNPQEMLPIINKSLSDIQKKVEEYDIDYLKQTDFDWLSFVIKYVTRDSNYRLKNRDELIDIINKIESLSSKIVKTNEYITSYKGVKIKTYGNNTEFLGNALARITQVIDSLPSTLLYQIKNLSSIELYDTVSPHNLSALFGFESLLNNPEIEYFETGALYRYKSNTVQIFRPTMMDENNEYIYEILTHELGHSLDSFMITAMGTGFTETTDLWKNAVEKDNNSISAYGDLDLQEDFAEMCSLYAKAINGYVDIDKVKNEYPERFKIMSALYDLNEVINSGINGNIPFDRKLEIMSIFDDYMGDDTTIIETLLGKDFIESYRNYSPVVKLSFARRMINHGISNQFQKLFVDRDYFHNFDGEQLLQFYNLYNNNALQHDILKLVLSVANGFELEEIQKGLEGTSYVNELCSNIQNGSVQGILSILDNCKTTISKEEYDNIMKLIFNSIKTGGV